MFAKRGLRGWWRQGSGGEVRGDECVGDSGTRAFRALFKAGRIHLNAPCFSHFGVQRLGPTITYLSYCLLTCPIVLRRRKINQRGGSVTRSRVSSVMKMMTKEKSNPSNCISGK